MGEVFRGIDPNLAMSLSKTHNFEVFVETGTFMGKTASWASHIFRRVYTIERHEEFYENLKVSLAEYPNVYLFLGNSSEKLYEIFHDFETSALVWLDAHWSRDLGYSRPDIICPILSEIEVLRNDGRDHAIMVDDARLFGIESGWPSLKEVKKALSFADRNVFILNDIIVSIP